MALTAGFDNTTADAVVVLDSDLQPQPEDIPKLIEKWREGYNVVWGVTKKRRDPFLTRIPAKLFYWLFNKIANIKVPGEFAMVLFDNQSIKAIREFRERSRLILGIYSEIGFKHAEVEVQKQERFAGEIKYTFRK